MKGIYWRPQRTSPAALAVVAAFASVGVLALEQMPGSEQQALYEEKMRAARLALRAFEAIGLERLRLGIPIEPAYDPLGSGLIGTESSPIASNYGHLPAKQTAINPNFAAVAVELFHEAGLGKGDVVAIGVSGSFPAVNVAVYCAAEVLELEPVVIASASASEFGATHPELTWLDMERVLAERDIIGFRAVAASLGGVDDRGAGHTKRGRELLREAIRRNGRPFLDADTLADGVDERLRVIDAATGGKRVAAYVNVGGGAASMGESENREQFSPGINERAPPGLTARSVAREILRAGAPVINFTHIERLARRYGLPTEPVEMASPGEGHVFVAPTYSRTGAVVLILAIIAALYATTRLDAGFRLGGGGKSSGGGDQAPEQMI